ncbi:MAG: polysaccharide deacetylase family protein [Christensenellaceae bacterium]|nr:polysaccharide deacetylase family protein [Christensenellaceae bacterium]
MTKRKKITLFSNLCIATILIGLGIAVFTVDLGAVFISVGAPVRNGSRTDSNISFMFVLEDDAKYVPEIVAMLRDTNTPATFFVGGNWASKNRDKVKLIAETPCLELGNHAFTNRNLASMKEKEQNAEIVNCHSIVKMITSSAITGSEVENGEDGDEIESRSGLEMNLFLPPNASFNKRTLRSAERNGYRTVIWSRNATDTKTLYNDAMRDVRAGDLILMRPNLSTYTFLSDALIKKSYEKLGLGIASVGDNLKPY